jgi:hypothetical protein
MAESGKEASCYIEASVSGCHGEDGDWLSEESVWFYTRGSVTWSSIRQALPSGLSHGGMC